MEILHYVVWTVVSLGSVWFSMWAACRYFNLPPFAHAAIMLVLTITLPNYVEWKKR